jgi:hypothetical protein
MFRQAKVIGHEYLSERERYSFVRNFRPATPTANFPEVQSVIMDVSPGDVYRCRDKLVTREIVGETIIVPISGELADLQQVYALNETGAFVWQHLDGVTALESIQQALTEAFTIDKQDAWTDLAELVTDLARAGLIEKV